MNAQEQTPRRKDERVEAPDAPPVSADGLANELEDLRSRVAAAESQRDEAEARYRRALADFTNYQRRSLANEDDARDRGVAGVIESVIPALDHFEQALGHDPAKMTSEALCKGMRLIQDELVRALGQHGAGVIQPGLNDEFDPQRHLAVARRAADGVAPGHIVEVYQTGYTLGERVLRPAKVVVAPTEDSE